MRQTQAGIGEDTILEQREHQAEFLARHRGLRADSESTDLVAAAASGLTSRSPGLRDILSTFSHRLPERGQSEVVLNVVVQQAVPRKLADADWSM